MLVVAAEAIGLAGRLAAGAFAVLGDDKSAESHESASDENGRDAGS